LELPPRRASQESILGVSRDSRDPRGRFPGCLGAGGLQNQNIPDNYPDFGGFYYR